MPLFLSFGSLRRSCLSGFLGNGFLPLPQSLHLARVQFAEVLFLHVQAAKFSAEGIMGDVLLLLGLHKQNKTQD